MRSMSPALIPAMAPVALVRTRPAANAVHEAVERAMRIADWKRHIPVGADVTLKPNLGWDKLIPGAISAPWVVEGAILALRGHAGSVVLAESDQVVVDADRALHVSGLDAVCRRHGVPWVNMSRGRFVRIQDTSRLVLRDVMLPEILTRTLVLSLPVLKTHNKTTITGALKNQWGCLELLRHTYHPVLSQALVDVNTLVRPRFAVMDATVGLEGNGPKSGRPREVGAILASADLVGLDATAARLVGFEPTAIEHLALCAAHGLGRIVGTDEVLGDRVDECTVRFSPARHNAVSALERLLRGSLVGRAAFNPPMFGVLCWGARRWYDLWDLHVGRRVRHTFFLNSAYARQWTENIANPDTSRLRDPVPPSPDN